MPQRLLRPGITTSRRFNRCDYFAQSFYVRILTLVDDYGRYEADRELLRSHCFPFGAPDGSAIPLQAIEGGLLSLVSNKELFLYRHDGKEYLQVLTWKERIRSESKFPDPKNSVVLTSDSNCQQMTASPPSSPPTPSPSPSPTPLSVCAVPGESQPNPEPPVEPPPGFPDTSAAAEAHAGFVGCPREFASKVWNAAQSRGGRDSKDVPIRSFRYHLATCWTYERERVSKTAGADVSGNGGKKPASIMDLKTVIQIKEAKAQAIRLKHCTEVAGGTSWNDAAAKTEYFGVRREIKELQRRIETMV